MTFFRCLLMALLFSSSAYAESLYFGIRRGFEGTRAVGMGNAFVAVADDNTAIFYNPAGLSQLQKGESNWFLKADLDPDFLDLMDEVDKAGNDKTNEVQQITDLLAKNYGKHYSLRLPSLGFLWARPSWGLAIIPTDLSIDMRIDKSVGPAINLVAIQDTTIAFTKNWKINKWKDKGAFSVGVTGKLIYRMNVDELVSVANIALNDEVFNEKNAKEGMTLDADVGFLWKGPWERWNPSAGIVIRNIGDYGYFSNLKLIGDQTGSPQRLNRVIDIGSSIELPDWWIWSSKLAFDIRDMLHPNWNLMKGLHMGIEFQWKVFSWWRGGWRAGLNQGYPTLGFTGEFGIFKLDLATYGEDVGIADQRIQNRRYMTTMSLDF
ncbi:MAG: hypothetical protein KDD33_01050 [Bdellovibrionales bacterium]|nr:hypothetical protein [Bdellovibrionales bacterium]